MTANVALRAVNVAIKNLGFGETTANNRGLFIRAIGGKDGMEWCALFVGHCYRRAYEMAGQEPPPWLYRRPGVAEPGALRLVSGLSKIGTHFVSPNHAQPGDLALWRRSGGHHVAIVEYEEDDVVHTIEGNVGRYPAKVKRLAHDVTKEPHFKGFAGLR